MVPQQLLALPSQSELLCMSIFHVHLKAQCPELPSTSAVTSRCLSRHGCIVVHRAGAVQVESNYIISFLLVLCRGIVCLAFPPPSQTGHPVSTPCQNVVGCCQKLGQLWHSEIQLLNKLEFGMPVAFWWYREATLCQTTTPMHKSCHNCKDLSIESNGPVLIVSLCNASLISSI